MEEKYKFFEDKYNKILDLIAMADEKLANKYKSTISSLPDPVFKKLERGKNFKVFAQDFQSTLNFDGEMLEFDYTQYNKYFDVAIKIYPLYEEEFSDEVEDDDIDEAMEELQDDLFKMNQWFIFSLTKSNVKGIAKLRIDYELEDNELKYVGTDINGVEIDYQVFVEKRDKDYYIMITKYLNGHELLKKEIPIEYEELIEYSAVWDDINEDRVQNEFDAED